MIHWIFVLYLIIGGMIAGVAALENWPERKVVTIAAVIFFVIVGPVIYAAGYVRYLWKHFPYFIRSKAWGEYFRGEWDNLPPDRIASFKKAAPFYFAEKNLSVNLWLRAVARKNKIKL